MIKRLNDSGFLSIVFTSALAIAMAACGGDDDDEGAGGFGPAAGSGSGSGQDLVVASCQRLDQCSLLNPEVSVDDCIELVDDALAGSSADAQAEWEFLVEGCLGETTCDGFEVCLEESGLT